MPPGSLMRHLLLSFRVAVWAMLIPGTCLAVVPGSAVRPVRQAESTIAASREADAELAMIPQLVLSPIDYRTAGQAQEVAGDDHDQPWNHSSLQPAWWDAGPSDVVTCSACGVCGTCGCNRNGGSGGTGWNQYVAGYDDGFVIASRKELELNSERQPFRLRINGWGQLRHTITDVQDPNRDLNQFQLKRGRLVFSGNAYSPNIQYFVQLDGRSSSGDNVRLLDYYLSFDFGNELFALEPGTIGFRTGMYKMPFTLAREISGRDFEFADRSMASTYFDVNRSFAWGLYGERRQSLIPMTWDIAIFNGLVTGGAETGASGSLDENFAYSARIMMYPIGDWGNASLADLEYHEQLAMRIGVGFASSEIDRGGATEFQVIRVVDSGQTLASLLAPSVASYGVNLYCIDASFKYRGWSTTIENYFRQIEGFHGGSVPALFDHGFWLQVGYMIVPEKFQLLGRWSRVVGDSGTLGATTESSDEIGGGLAWYFRGNRSKLVVDLTHVNGAPIQSAALDINAGDDGWICRSQIQFRF